MASTAGTAGTASMASTAGMNSTAATGQRLPDLVPDLHQVEYRRHCQHWHAWHGQRGWCRTFTR
jgi:hypothetical protein